MEVYSSYTKFTEFSCHLVSKASQFYRDIEFYGVENIVSINACNFSKNTSVALDIERSFLNDTAVILLKTYLPTIKITHFSIKENQISKDSALIVSEALSKSEIQNLSIVLMRPENINVALNAVPKMKYLNALSVSMNYGAGPMSLNTCRLLAKAVEMSNLRKLSLSLLDPNAIVEISECLLGSKISELCVTDSSFDEESIASLLSIISLTEITKLDLSSNDFSGSTDEFCFLISETISMKYD